MKSVKRSMDLLKLQKLLLRCYREINHSTSLEMLRAAQIYSLLFVQHLVRNNVKASNIENIQRILTNAYKRKHKTLTI